MNNKYETLYIKSRGSNVVRSSIEFIIQRSQSSTFNTLKTLYVPKLFIAHSQTESKQPNFIPNTEIVFVFHKNMKNQIVFTREQLLGFPPVRKKRDTNDNENKLNRRKDTIISLGDNMNSPSILRWLCNKILFFLFLLSRKTLIKTKHKNMK